MAWRIVSFAAVLAFGGFLGIIWYRAAGRAEERWRAALKRYAEKDAAKRDSRVERH